MAKRPLIGITMRLELATRRFYLGRDYSEAVAGIGGIPIHIPLIPNKNEIDDLVDRLDGILLPGSDSDVDPFYYGEQPHAKLGTVIPEKDMTDRLVIAAADRRQLPILGICYGMQALNVYRNGSLIQDIASQVPHFLKHQQGIPLEPASHSIRAENESILKGLADAAGITPDLRVNSHHHQAVKVVGSGLKATAWANDGVIECIESTDPERFEFAVQWHPELSWKADPLSYSIFASFINSCQLMDQKRASAG